MPIMIPDEWRETLKQLKLAGFPDAVIGGGALRDLTNAVPVKDVDIFVQYRERGHFEAGLNEVFPYDYVPQPASEPVLKDVAGWHWEVTDDAIHYMGAAFDNVSAVANGTRLGHKLPYQIIGTPAPVTVENALSRFDFGICQILYDGSACYSTDAFVKDVREKTFTLIRADNQAQFDRSMERWDRLSPKYPEHFCVIPPEFMWLKQAWELADRAA